MKGRVYAFDLTRVLCTFGIILFHFSVTTASEFKPLALFYNGAWGDIFVRIFFILSGGLLYANNKETSLASFYYKRWKSVFPSFYIGYILCFILTAHRDYGKLIKPFRYYIPTVLGMDGLINTFGFTERFPTVYLIGEWFMGAIVICYLFMPAVIRISKKADLVLLAVFFIFAHIIKFNYVSNVFAWLLYMQIGIVLIKWEIWKNSYVFLGSLVGCFFFSYIPVNMDVPVREVILSSLLFVAMSYLGQSVMKDEFLNRLILQLSKWSFCIFLVHHIIMDNVFIYANSLHLQKAFIELMFIMAASVVGGFALHTLTAWIERVPGILRKKYSSDKSIP